MGKTYAVQGNLALAVCEDDARSRMNPARFRVIAGSLDASTCIDSSVLPCGDTIAAADAKPLGYRHRRLLITLSMLILVAAISLCAASFAARAALANEAVSHAERMEVSVEPGSSLWSLAERHPIAGLTTDETVRVIRDWNRLASAELQPGQVLVVARS